MNTFNSTKEYYDALNKKICNGEYGELKHPEMSNWFVNSESATGIIKSIDSMISALDALDNTKWTALNAYRSFRNSMNWILISAKYPTISILPTKRDIIAIDNSYDIIINSINSNKENNNMNEVKDQMQESINKCNNTISFDEFDTKAKAMENKVKVTNDEEKIISSPRKDNIADICNIINIASTVVLAIKSYRNKRNTGKYRVSDLAIMILSGYITGSSIRETYKEFPTSRFGKLYCNIARFIKKVVEATKKLAGKTTRKEDIE